MEQKFNSHIPKKRMHMPENYSRDGERQSHTISNKMQINSSDSNEQRQAEINESIEKFNPNIAKYKSKIQRMTFKEDNFKKMSRYEYSTQQFEDRIKVLRNKMKTTDNKPIFDNKSNYDNSKQMINRIQNAFNSLSKKVDKYEGSSKLDPEYIHIHKMLVRFLIELNNIDTNGSEALRFERANVFKNIHKYVSILEHKIKTNVNSHRHSTGLPLENDETSDKTATCSGTSQNSGSSHVPKKREHKTMPLDMGYKDTNQKIQNQTSSRSNTERCHKFNKKQYKNDKRRHRLTTKMNKSFLSFLYALEKVINTLHEKHSNAKKILSTKRKLSLALDECIAKLNLMENENIKHEILPFFRQILSIMKDSFLAVCIMETLEIRDLKGETLRRDFRIKKVKIQAIQDARLFFKALETKLDLDFEMAYSRSTECDSKRGLESSLAICTERLKKLEEENWGDDYELLFLREMHRLILSNFAFNDAEVRYAKISDKNKVAAFTIFKKIESNIDKLENLANCFAGRSDDIEYFYINEMFTQNMIKLDDLDHPAPLLNETDIASISGGEAQLKIMCKINPCNNTGSLQNIHLYNVCEMTRSEPKKMNHSNVEAQLKFHDPASDQNELERLELMKSPNVSIDLIRNDLLALIKQVNLYSGGRDQCYNALRVSFLNIIDRLNAVKGGDDSVRFNLLNNAVFYLTVLDMKSKSGLREKLFKPDQKLPPSHQLQNTFTNHNTKETKIHIMDIDPNTLESHKSSQAKAFADINQKVAQIGDRLKQDTDISTLFIFHNQLMDNRSKIQKIHSDGEEALQNKHMSLKYIDALSVFLMLKLSTYNKNAC